MLPPVTLVPFDKSNETRVRVGGFIHSIRKTSEAVREARETKLAINRSCVVLRTESNAPGFPALSLDFRQLSGQSSKNLKESHDEGATQGFAGI